MDKVRFLVIRFSSIGDIVMTTLAVRCLKQQVEGAEVHFAIKQKFRGLVDANPHIDKVHVLDGPLNDYIKDLKSEQFDYVIDLHSSLRSRIIKSKLGLTSFTVNKQRFHKWLHFKFRYQKFRKIHLVEGFLETLKLFDVKNDGKGLDYFIPEKEKIDKKQLPEVAQNGYIAFVIGAMHFTKRLPVEKIINICKNIQYPILLIGGDMEKETGDKVQNEAGTHVVNLAGKYNLNQSISIADQSKFVISHDTGLMHISGALKKIVLSIWGSTSPEFAYPYGADARSVVFKNNNLKCNPCSKFGRSDCPKKHFKCLKEIDEQEIIQTAKNLLKELGT